MNDIVNKAYRLYNDRNLPGFIDLLYDQIDLLLEQKLDEEIIFEKKAEDISEIIEILYHMDDGYISLLRSIVLSFLMDSQLKFIGTEEMTLLPEEGKNILDSIYYIHVANSRELIKLFQIYIVFFYLQGEGTLGIDFEFTLRKNQLMQMAFESRQTPISILWIVKLEEFTKDELDRFFKTCFLNEKIIKIIHGSDSQDFPFICDILLEGKADLIKKFTYQMIDTRFICEYYKIMQNDLPNKCSIYDALLYFGVLSKEQHERLEKIIYDMGPSSDISWNIHMLSKAQTLYALYDVLYLKQFHLKILKMAQEQIGEENLSLFTKLLVEMIRFVYLERRELSNIAVRCKAEIDPINNYMIRRSRTGKNVNMTLINIFNTVIKGIIFPDPIHELDKLLAVNFFKTPFTNIMKKIIYSILVLNYRVYKDKFNIFSEKMSLKFIFDHLNGEGFVNIKKMLEQFIIIVSSRIDSLIE